MNTYPKNGEGGLGIYIQVPFCQTKCTYCNFHTGVASPAAYAPYARAVDREIRDWRPLHAAANLESTSRLAPAVANSIYFGGGTPSLFDPADLARVLAAVHSQFPDADPIALSSSGGAASKEVTLEADPETITPEKAAA